MISDNPSRIKNKAEYRTGNSPSKTGYSNNPVLVRDVLARQKSSLASNTRFITDIPVDIRSSESLDNARFFEFTPNLPDLLKSSVSPVKSMVISAANVRKYCSMGRKFRSGKSVCIPGKKPDREGKAELPILAIVPGKAILSEGHCRCWPAEIGCISAAFQGKGGAE